MLIVLYDYDYNKKRVYGGRFQHFDKVLDFYYIAPTMTMTVTTISVGFVES